MSRIACRLTRRARSLQRPSHGWVLTQEPDPSLTLHLFATTDGGGLWTELPWPRWAVWSGKGGIGDLQFRRPNDGWLGAAADRPRFTPRTDGGATWQPHVLPNLPPHDPALGGKPIPPGGLGSAYSTRVTLLPGSGVIAFRRLRTSGVAPSPHSTAARPGARSRPRRKRRATRTSCSGLDALVGDAVRHPVEVSGRGADLEARWPAARRLEYRPHVIDAKHAWAELRISTGSRFPVTGLAMSSDAGLHWTYVKRAQAGISSPQAMGPVEPEADYDPSMESSRARRGLTVMFHLGGRDRRDRHRLHPPFAKPPDVLSLPATYQLEGVDFVNATTGWFVAKFDSGRFALLHTGDAGRTWTTSLPATPISAASYMRFFDSSHGVFALLGNQPLTFQTSDGGRTWSSQATVNSSAYVQSVSFIDPRHGWLLARSTTNPDDIQLLRTADGGTTWANLGLAGVQRAAGRIGCSSWTPPSDARHRVGQAARVQEHRRRRELDTGPTPGAQRWMAATGQFFVAAQATHGAGVVATVVNFVPYVGRTGVGEQVIAFPPLTVRAFDGGLPVVVPLRDFRRRHPRLDLRKAATGSTSGRYAQAYAPNQVQLGSLDGGLTWKVIEPPAGAGAIGYSDARNWWWIGSGMWSRSSDGGATWTVARNIGVISAAPRNPDAARLKTCRGTAPWRQQCSARTNRRRWLHLGDDRSACDYALT